jgi:hypothetical protein
MRMKAAASFLSPGRPPFDCETQKTSPAPPFEVEVAAKLYCNIRAGQGSAHICKYPFKAQAGGLALCRSHSGTRFLAQEHGKRHIHLFADLDQEGI